MQHDGGAWWDKDKPVISAQSPQHMLMVFPYLQFDISYVVVLGLVIFLPVNWSSIEKCRVVKIVKLGDIAGAYAGL